MTRRYIYFQTLGGDLDKEILEKSEEEVDEFLVETSFSAIDFAVTRDKNRVKKALETPCVACSGTGSVMHLSKKQKLAQQFAQTVLAEYESIGMAAAEIEHHKTKKEKQEEEKKKEKLEKRHPGRRARTEDSENLNRMVLAVSRANLVINPEAAGDLAKSQHKKDQKEKKNGHSKKAAPSMVDDVMGALSALDMLAIPAKHQGADGKRDKKSSSKAAASSSKSKAGPGAGSGKGKAAGGSGKGKAAGGSGKGKKAGSSEPAADEVLEQAMLDMAMLDLTSLSIPATSNEGSGNGKQGDGKKGGKGGKGGKGDGKKGSKGKSNGDTSSNPLHTVSPLGLLVDDVEV